MSNGNIGAQGVSWTVFGAECLSAVYDLRWMIILAVLLIATDYWWGVRELAERRKKAKRKIDKERYKFHFSQAGRRTLNKAVDYLTFLLVGCVTGLAITEPMGICGHTTTAAIGLGFGCLFELSSIVGHVCFVKGVYIKINYKKLIVAILTLKWKQLAGIFKDAIEYIGDDEEEYHNHHCGQDVEHENEESDGDEIE